MAKLKESPVFRQVYQIVMQIPAGRVLTYGAISALMEGRLSAQAVGWALNALPDSCASNQNEAKVVEFHAGNVPWHRVINSRGGVSTTKKPELPEDQQRIMLEAEGVVFKSDGYVELSEYMWSKRLSKQ